MSPSVSRSASRPLRAAGLGLVLGVGISACTLYQTVRPVKKQPKENTPVSAEKTPREAAPEPDGPLDYTPFELKPEPEVPCKAVDLVDVNLGHTPEAFVKAAHCQVTGKPAAGAVVQEWSAKLREGKLTRRIDVVLQLCADHGKKCKLAYSDPWKSQPELSGAPQRKVKREVGAVFMFFFDCPGKTNCEMDWANTHAPGMAAKHPFRAFGDAPGGYYKSNHAGFWRSELLDAQWAGLSFVMPNVYGPDIEEGKLAPLMEALESIEDPPKIAMFDDSWTWGEPWFSDFWKQKPNLADTEKTAKTIYDAKWKPFFSQVDKKYWYRFEGKPFIYFYNAGKLNPRSQTAPVITKMKEMFQADFGEEPFVSVDTAYFEDKRMKQVAGTEFRWFTFQLPGKKSRSTLHGHTFDHAMVRWDAVGRDRRGEVAKPGDLLVKDGRVLRQVLDSSKDADVLVIATWNDLGEGTGVNRNYDYYVRGRWLAPNHFMKMIRDSQSGK